MLTPPLKDGFFVAKHREFLGAALGGAASLSLSRATLAQQPAVAIATHEIGGIL